MGDVKPEVVGTAARDTTEEVEVKSGSGCRRDETGSDRKWMDYLQFDVELFLQRQDALLGHRQRLIRPRHFRMR